MGNITQNALGKLAHDPFGRMFKFLAHHPNGARTMSYDVVKTPGRTQITSLNVKGNFLLKAAKTVARLPAEMTSKLARHFVLPEVLPGRWYL